MWEAIEAGLHKAYNAGLRVGICIGVFLGVAMQTLIARLFL
jgi:hypothetical protein